MTSTRIQGAVSASFSSVVDPNVLLLETGDPVQLAVARIKQSIRSTDFFPMIVAESSLGAQTLRPAFGRYLTSPTDATKQPLTCI